MARFFSVVVLVLLTLLEIGPFPITGLILLWIVIFRPVWFFKLVISIYAGKKGIHDPSKTNSA